MKNKDILKLKIVNPDFDTDIKGYLKMLLSELWLQGESFSGKRPFGDSGWEYDIYATLAKNDVIEAEFDEYGDLIEFNTEVATDVINEAIEYIFK